MPRSSRNINSRPQQVSPLADISVHAWVSPRAHYRGLTAFQKRGREPRFADAGLAREEHHPAFAVLCFAQRRSSSSDSSSRPTRAVRPLACSASKRISTELARSAAQTRAKIAKPTRSKLVKGPAESGEICSVEVEEK
jgi:hypothetical protein